MDIGSILLILALLIPVVLFIARPFYEPRLAEEEGLTQREDHDLSGLLAERDRILTALQELEFDHVLGKIPNEDYPAQRAGLVQRGAEILRKLDQLPVAGALPEARTGDAEERVEAVIAQRGMDAALQPASSNMGHAADDDIEVALAQRRRQRLEKSAGFCPQCGGPVQKSDRFCPKCGKVLASQA
jgi:hypothetical protein